MYQREQSRNNVSVTVVPVAGPQLGQGVHQGAADDNLKREISYGTVAMPELNSFEIDQANIVCK